MPTLKHPPDHVALEVPVLSRYHPTALSTHIYLAIIFLAVLVVARLLTTRILPKRASRLRTPNVKPEPGRISEPAREKDWARFSPSFGPGPGYHRPQASWTPLRVVSGQLAGPRKLSTMDGSDGELEQDHDPWSARTTSRGVSTCSPKPSHGPSPTSPNSVMVSGRTRHNRSPSRASRASSRKRHSGSWDAADCQAPKGKGNGPVVGSSGRVSDGPQNMEVDGATGAANDGRFHRRSLPDAHLPELDLSFPNRFSRPPLPPPLTPPTLSNAVFPFEDRRLSFAASIAPALDAGFIHQPNPEYGGGPTPTEVLAANSQSATAIPRRRSYTRSVPIGIPKPAIADSASSSSKMMISRSSSKAFSPSSYPPTSPLLPPPPPGQYGPLRSLPPPPPPPPRKYEFVGGPGGPGVFLSQQEIDLQGEIISVMDDAGHGWKRHTRVYGGGVCLACVAAAGGDGGGQGGFYGDKVPLADRR